MCQSFQQHVHRAKAIADTADRNPLELDPLLTPPAYLTEVDIHCMPGNYQSEHTENDISQGRSSSAGPTCTTAGSWGRTTLPSVACWSRRTASRCRISPNPAVQRDRLSPPRLRAQRIRSGCSHLS
jgi:hypothetical protein